MRERLAFILKQFNICADITSWHKIGTGHINDTYRADTSYGSFIVQKINGSVFADPGAVMRNIRTISDHLKRRGSSVRIPEYYTSGNNNYYESEGEYWRVTDYIGNSFTPEAHDITPDILKGAGRAFGAFGKELADLDVSDLTCTISGFHDTLGRIESLIASADKDPLGRAETCRKELESILESRELAAELRDHISAGEVPLRVTHNDTKLDNILFDKTSMEPLAILDLDTCMPGYLCHDFGDAIRSACSTACEDDPENMDFDIEAFRAFTEGYLSEAGCFMTEAECETLAHGPSVITLELAARFLTDYIEGDRYFSISYPEDNLQRARAQLKLLDSMTEHQDLLKKYINR